MDLTIPRPQDLGYLSELRKPNGSLSVAEYARILHSSCRRQEPNEWGKDLKAEFKQLEMLVHSWLDHEWEICPLCLKGGAKINDCNVVSKKAFGTALEIPPPGCPEEFKVVGDYLADDGVTVIEFPEPYRGCRECIAEIKRQAAELKPAPIKGWITTGEFAGCPELPNRQDRAEYMDLFGPPYLERDAAWLARRERFINL